MCRCNYTQTYGLYIHTCVNTCAYTHTHVHTHTHTHTDMHTYTHTFILLFRSNFQERNQNFKINFHLVCILLNIFACKHIGKQKCSIFLLFLSSFLSNICCLYMMIVVLTVRKSLMKVPVCIVLLKSAVHLGHSNVLGGFEFSPRTHH